MHTTLRASNKVFQLMYIGYFHRTSENCGIIEQSYYMGNCLIAEKGSV